MPAGRKQQGEIVKQTSLMDTTTAVVPVRETSLLEVIARAAADPQVDVAKMQALLDMKFKLEDRDREDAFNRALATVQPKLPIIPRLGTIKVKGVERSKFARLEDVIAQTRPLLTESGIGVTFFEQDGDPKLGLVIVMEVRHASGYVKPVSRRLPVDVNDYRTNIQNHQSTISYAKRTMYVDFFGIVTEDTDKDGNETSKVSEEDLRKIDDLVEATGTNVQQMLQMYQVERLVDLTVPNAKGALMMLRQKAATRDKKG